MTPETVTNPTIARPRRPIPNENAEVARLAEMVIALLGEVAVLTERLDTVERLLAAHALVGPDEIESYVADAAAQRERDARRRRLVATVLRPLRVAAEDRARPMEDPR